MTSTPGRPPVADLATWRAARAELLIREKAHTREGDAIAAARRRLPIKPEGWPSGQRSCWYWRSDADGNWNWGPTSRPVPQWTRPGATPEESLGRSGEHNF